MKTEITNTIRITQGGLTIELNKREAEELHRNLSEFLNLKPLQTFPAIQRVEYPVWPTGPWTITCATDGVGES